MKITGRLIDGENDHKSRLHCNPLLDHDPPLKNQSVNEGANENYNPE